MTLAIRRATEADAPALSQICILTADAGKSAEPLHDFGEFPGLVYAVPYVKLPTAWAFVLVDESKDQLAVGYIVGSTDTRAFERYAAEHWWPLQAEKYPPSVAVREADKKYANLLRNMHTATDATIAFAPAHLHINILEEYQRQGWGRKLIATAVEHLKVEGVEGVWLGMDPRNLNARRFYERLGFAGFDDAPEGVVGLRFE
ncbi:acyl-CoA N-acyltransferase [Mycena sp. CBHHK59/15]|nr:acyl-CoA N-acyltransferase [Mycena sp. CBHHK59/15]